MADIDLSALTGFHEEQGRLATMTVVQPELQFGIARLNGAGRVEGFTEKPRFEGWINGGFFVFEPGVLDYLEADSVLEREPLERLAAARRAERLQALRLLGLHGHIQGRRAAQRPVVGGPRALEAVVLNASR